MAPKVTKTKKMTSAQAKLEIPVFDVKGIETKKISLSEDIFHTKVNKALVAQYVRIYLQNQRQGTVATKTRGEVIGTTKKIYRQKGTGGARHGSKKAPIFVGGGVTFGPHPRTFALSLNKKQKRQALFSSLTEKAAQGTIAAIENAFMEIEPKTKVIATFLKKAGFENKKLLVVLPEIKENGFVLSIRNIPNIELIQAQSLNPYIVMNNTQTLFVEGALEVLEKHFLKKNEN